MKNKKILLVEDETDVMLSNHEYLSMKKMEVLIADSLREAAEILEHEDVDIILLDVVLPDGNGISFMNHIREHTQVPVLFLTCMGETSDVVRGLSAGGVDYITKPYKLEELYARICTHLRQSEAFNQLPNKMMVGNIRLDLELNRAYVDDEDAMLKPLEFLVLLYLARHRDHLVTGKELYQAVWGCSDNDDTRTVRVHIHEIRKKLGMPKENIPEHYPYLETVFGKGYVLCMKASDH